VSPLAVILVSLFVFWVFGGVAMRLGGGLLAIVAIVAIAVGSPPGTWLLVLVMGSVVWLLGQWHYAAGHKIDGHPMYKSTMAMAILERFRASRRPNPFARFRREQPRPPRSPTVVMSSSSRPEGPQATLTPPEDSRPPWIAPPPRPLLRWPWKKK
jgi:hypothetical protein